MCFGSLLGKLLGLLQSHHSDELNHGGRVFVPHKIQSAPPLYVRLESVLSPSSV